MGDPTLAKWTREARVKAPVERISRTDWLLTVQNREKLGKDPCRRFVLLACGHTTVTRNQLRAPCPECHRMILEGEDYERFQREVLGRNKGIET